MKDQTDIGGHGGGFPETRWTAIGDLQNGSGSAEAATGQFLQAYWKPVYFFLRGKGYDNEAAKDLTQGFFCDIVLGQKLLAGADRSKGRFRSLPLTSLRNYVVDGLRAGAAAKRRPAKSQFSLDAINQGAINLPDVEMGPDEAFSYTWASSLLDEVSGSVNKWPTRSGPGRVACVSFSSASPLQPCRCCWWPAPCP